MFPQTRFLAVAVPVAAILMLSACSSQATEEDFTEILTANGVSQEHTRITGPDSEGMFIAVYEVNEGCELHISWDGGEKPVIVGAQADRYFHPAPETTYLEGFGADRMSQACEGEF
ncbi:hypothetical protein [Nocardiopsis algeriensis]|uniref:Lipoprotein n=1 Tax=Nocardiopsis algeriensis TaxID=1478215 RepID=A0A841IV03_9ACTN|nr:hypothetical protein [Nocardiopsis algeriensis]MBB6122002.1 hypothetical protein [Nocardiopsis algeriensis]